MKQILYCKPGTIKVDGRTLEDVGKINYPADDVLNKTKDWRRQTYEMQCEMSEDTKEKMFRLVYGTRIERLVARMWQFYKPLGRRK